MTRLSLFIVWLLIAPRLDAQEARSLQGSWRACFALTALVPGAPSQVCGEVNLPSGTACGSPILRFTVPIDSLRPPLPYHGGDVQLTLTDSTISFGGRTVEQASSNPSQSRCQFYGDDGSLYGFGTFDGSALAGTWGISGFAADTPLGTFTMRRE